jgi:hypothetical protein
MIKQMVMFAASLASRGLGNNKTDIETKQLRVVSCFGIENKIARCPYLKLSPNHKNKHFCVRCGCGDKPHTWLLKDSSDYSKLDYPVLNCPIHMPGFTNYDPNFTLPEMKERKEQIESMSTEELNLVQVTIGKTE